MDTRIEKKIENIVNTIIADVEREHPVESLSGQVRLDKPAILAALEDIERILLPAHFGNRQGAADFAMRYDLGGAVERVYSTLCNQVERALRFKDEYRDMAYEERFAASCDIAEKFIDRLITVREYLKLDLEAFYDGDPAAYNFDEIVYSYPGFYAILVSRVAHELYLLGVPLIPRILTENAHSATGIDIHPGATLGRYFFIDHGTGVVVGETTVIGDHVKLYQGVTLGALSTRAGQGLKGKRRHPTIGNNVTIYSNASVLGGDTIVGDGSIIGGSCFITESIPANSRVNAQTPSPEIRQGPQTE